MKLYKNPFLYIVLFTILGIELQSTYAFNFTSISILFVSLLVSTWVSSRFSKKKYLQSFLFGASFIAGGCLLLSAGELRQNKSSNDSFLVKITETASNDKVWKKTIGTRKAIIHSNYIEASEELILLYFESDKIEVGDWLIVNSDLKKIENKNNPGEFNSERYWRIKGIDKMTFVGENQFLFMDNEENGWLEKQWVHSRSYFNHILSEYLDNDELAVAKALMLGDKGSLTKDLKTSFGKAGAMHVLAVSGLHVGIILYILIFIFKQFPKWISKRNSLIFSLIIIWIYAGITGFSPSVLRATIMFSLVSLSVVFGRKNNSLNALFFSAFLMILWDPLIIYDIGFQLSYLAMIGIFSFYQPISHLFFFKNCVFRKAWEGTSIGIAAQLTTFPLVLYYFHQFPNYFALTNIGMMVFAGVVLGIGLVLFSFQWVSVLGKIIGFIFLFSLSLMIYFIEFVENLPGSIAKGFVLSPEMIVFLYILLLLFYFFGKYRIILISTIAISFVTFGFIQFNRFENLNKAELIVFNSNDIIIGVKWRNRIICIHEERKNGLKNAMYFAETYEKIRPAEIVYLSFVEGVNRLEIGNSIVEMNYSNDGVHLEFDDRKITLRSSYKMPSKEDDFIIDAPFLIENPQNYSLMNGAYTAELKLKP